MTDEGTQTQEVEYDPDNPEITVSVTYNRMTGQLQMDHPPNVQLTLGIMRLAEAQINLRMADLVEEQRMAQQAAAQARDGIQIVRDMPPGLRKPN